MKRTVALLVMAAVIVVSGCTDSYLATQEDLQEQTRDINQHTSEALQKDSNLVRKIWITDIEMDGTCANESVHEEERGFGDFERITPEVYERDSEIQEFLGGSYLVRNGLDLSAVDAPWCGADMELEDLSLESVEYNKTIFQNGSVISTASSNCPMYEDIWVEESRIEIEEQLFEKGKKIYTECLDIPIESWNPVFVGDGIQ